MGIIDKIGDRIDETDRRNRAGRMAHSRSYQNYFEGYTERYVFDENGRRRIERIYTGSYFIPKSSGGKRILIKILYVLIMLASLGLYVIAAWKQGTAWYLAVPVALAVPFLFLTIVALGYFVAVKRKMTVYTYKQSSVRLKRYSIISAACLALGAAVNIAHIIAAGSSANWLSAGLFAAGAVLLTLLFFMENRAEYEVEASENEPEEGFEMG